MVPVTYDSRLLLTDDLSSVVSMLTVCKLCSFDPQSLTSLKVIRDVINASTATSSCNFTDVVNYVVFDEVSSEEEFRLIFPAAGHGLQIVEVDPPRPHETHQLCNIYSFPRLDRCRIELVRLCASGEWLHKF
jgi:hypothetical protein